MIHMAIEDEKGFYPKTACGKSTSFVGEVTTLWDSVTCEECKTKKREGK